MTFLNIFFKSIQGDDSIKNVVGRVKSLEETPAVYECEMKFTASHFFEIWSSDIYNLSFDILTVIRNREGLKMESEDESISK
jgi:hypothetical protein